MILFSMLLLGCPKSTETTTAIKANCPAADAPLPEAEAIFARHKSVTQPNGPVEWSNLHQGGVIRIPQANIEGTLDIWVDRSKGYLSRLEMPGMGLTEQGWNTEVGWMIDPNTGARLLEGEELNNIAFTFKEITTDDLSKLYMSSKVVERRPIDEYDAYVVRVQVKNLSSPTELYFDACTGLQVGSKKMINIPMGRLTVHNLFKNYRDQSGMLMPFTVEQRAMGVLQVIEVGDVSWNPSEFPEIELPGALQESPDSKPDQEEPSETVDTQKTESDASGE